MVIRVTMQDIADAVGVSRNTVSKALNNTGILADSTRVRILQKAQEMGYKQFSYSSMERADTPKVNKEIALFSTSLPGNSHFASTMLDSFHRGIAEFGYTMSIHIIRPADIQQMTFPTTFNPERTDGIICIEMFCSDYNNMILESEIPVLFVDSPPNINNFAIKADRLYMENRSSIHALVKEMARRNKTKIGFIGEYMHCQSFFERYMGYREAMFMLGIPCLEQYCILGNDPDTTYSAYLTDALSKMKELPDVFICANDFAAINVLQVFKQLNISVPKDVYLCGFDDSPESKVITPSLTTVHIHSRIIGFTAVQLLISRIKEPELQYRTIYTETTPIFRESTED